MRRRSAMRSSQKDIETDVLIIGAGITGAMIADALTQAGFRVVMVDRRHDPVKGSTVASTALVQYEIDTPLSICSHARSARRMRYAPGDGRGSQSMRSPRGCANLTCPTSPAATGFISPAMSSMPTVSRANTRRGARPGCRTACCRARS